MYEYLLLAGITSAMYLLLSIFVKRNRAQVKDNNAKEKSTELSTPTHLILVFLSTMASGLLLHYTKTYQLIGVMKKTSTPAFTSGPDF